MFWVLTRCVTNGIIKVCYTEREVKDMCVNAKRCEVCNHRQRIIKLVHMEYKGEYKGIWLCEECQERLEKEIAERVGVENATK